MNKLYVYRFFFIAFSTTFLCFTPFAQSSGIPKVTVFVHGSDTTPKTFIPMIERYLHHAPGMYSLQTINPSYRYARYINNLCSYNSEIFPQEHMYLFCWSGKLSNSERSNAANNLHEALEILISFYKEKYETIDLTIITHSHGGNVVLNLAHIKEKPNYSIRTLILMATPVQEKTKYLVDHTCFKETKMYALYSTLDIHQIIDPQGLNIKIKSYLNFFNKQTITKKELETPFFSERMFSSDHIKHIKIKTKMGILSHIEFILPSFAKKMTSLLESAQKHDFSSEEILIVTY